MKRGRKPPIHTPLVCAGCGDLPHFKDGAIQMCACGQEWNLVLIEGARMPAWLEHAMDRPPVELNEDEWAWEK